MIGLSDDPVLMIVSTLLKGSKFEAAGFCHCRSGRAGAETHRRGNTPSSLMTG